MANEIYDSTWWGNTIDTASSIGTSTEMIQGQFNLTKLGDELVTNGDFATNLSGWNNGNSYWQWSSKGAYHPLGSVNNGFNQSSFTNQSNKLTFSVEIISGTLAVEFAGVHLFNESGVYTIYGTTGVVNFKRSGSVECYIDNVSVKLVRATTVEASKCLADAIHRIGIQDIQN